VIESNWLDNVAAITEKPNVTIARYHAFNLMQAKPIRSPTPAESNPPNRSANTKIAADKAPTGIWVVPRKLIAAFDIELPIIADAKPPTPKNTACPSEPCPEFAKKFQLAA
jgi:hypothetical protein